MKYLKIKDLAEELGISKQAVYKRLNQPDCKPYLHEVDRVRCITEEGVRFAFPTRVRFETVDAEEFEEVHQSTKVENELNNDAEKSHTAIEKTMQFQLMAHQKEVDWLRSWVDKLTDELQRERETSRQEIEQLTATIREMASKPEVDPDSHKREIALEEQVRQLREQLETPKKRGFFKFWG